jgi:hypothetical protein
VIDVEFKEGKGSAYGDEEVQNETEGWKTRPSSADGD